MTIIEGIVDWLKDYPIDFIDIKVDQLDGEQDSYGAFKLPNATVTKYIDGSQDVNEYYMFAVRKPTALDFQRITNTDWMEKLEKWIEKQNEERNLPAVTNVNIYNIAVASTFYMSESSEEDGVYQLSLEIQYERS